MPASLFNYFDSFHQNKALDTKILIDYFSPEHSILSNDKPISAMEE